MAYSVPLPLLENYDYAAHAYTPPVTSALADEVAARAVEILERLEYGNSARLHDQLHAIALATRYPLKGQKTPRHEWDLSWIKESDLDFLDYLLSITIDTPGNNRTKCACVVAALHWALTRQEGGGGLGAVQGGDLSPALKALGLNVTHAGFKVSDYLTIFNG